jgi:hypothetical protein
MGMGQLLKHGFEFRIAGKISGIGFYETLANLCQMPLVDFQVERDSSFLVMLAKSSHPLRNRTAPGLPPLKCKRGANRTDNDIIVTRILVGIGQPNQSWR